MNIITGRPPGVYSIKDRHLVEGLRNLPEMDFFVIAGYSISNKTTLFEEFVRKVPVFENCGMNWDAFYDCFMSYPVGKSNIAIFVIDNFAHFAKQNADDFVMACSIFSDVASQVSPDLAYYYILIGRKEDVPEVLHINQLT